MQSVTIDISVLTEKLKGNRAEHQNTYKQAMKGYTEAAALFFRQQLERIEEGVEFSTLFEDPKPEDHTSDYDVVLDMLRYSEDDAVTLSRREFEQYVLDQWGWKQSFTATTSNYLLPR